MIVIKPRRTAPLRCTNNFIDSIAVAAQGKPYKIAWKAYSNPVYRRCSALSIIRTLVIGVAKDDGNSCPCTLPVRLKGIDYGYLLRYDDEYGAQDSAGRSYPLPSLRIIT